MTDMVARLRQLEAAATPGPWWATATEVNFGDADDNDLNLTVAARNALPQLLDIAEAAGRELKALAEWAGEQNAGNAFATQVRLWARTKLDALAALDSQETE